MNKILNLKQIQKIELGVLKEFDTICKKYNLKYTLTGGTLLGAVRHKGFIPWDDDIDVSMPREDYNEFCRIYDNSKSYYKLISIYNNENYGFLSARMYDSRTIIEENIVNRLNAKYGLFIDIFPIDNLGGTYQKALKNFNNNYYLKNLLIASNWSKYSVSKTHSLIYEPFRLYFYLASRFTNPNKLAKKLDSKFQGISKTENNFQGVRCGVYKTKEIFNKEIFNCTLLFEFEGMKFDCIERYDEFLTQFYGDYMILPPIEKRITHHTFDAYILSEYADMLI